MHNDVVQSSIHSTDTHGYSEAIFGAMHLLGFSYAPRIKNFKRQSLYLFKNRKETDRSEWKVIPSGYVNSELIENNWDDILRLIVTIKLKETTASDLFRRLNSYSKQHPLYAALKAFGRIPKSVFLLRYIDDVELRQVIEKQLIRLRVHIDSLGTFPLATDESCFSPRSKSKKSRRHASASLRTQ
jgi:TnpA family transposase